MVRNTKPPTLKFFEFLILSLAVLGTAGCSIDASMGGRLSRGGGSSSSGGSFKVSIADKTISEYGVASLTVTLSEASSSNVQIQYQTENDTAISGTDYVAVSGTVTVPAGETTAVISVPVNDNLNKTANRSFRVKLSGLTAEQFTKSTGTVEIQDDDVGPLPTGATSIDASVENSCAVIGGKATCWGSNAYSILSALPTWNILVPTELQGLPNDIVDVQMGRQHGCALTNAGAVKCWGSNWNGELGNGTTTSSVTPVDVTGLSSGVAEISVGDSHSCARLATGGMKCWGNNSGGKLGDASSSNRNIPVDVVGYTTDVAVISAGNSHTCAVSTSGAARCWGSNWSGVVGDGSTTDRNIPTDVDSLNSGVVSITTGSYHTCALMGTGAVKCWGRNSSGALGDGTTSSSLIPVDVSGLSTATAVSAGGYTSCAMTSAGGLKCWGSNGRGQLDPTLGIKSSSTPLDVAGMSSGLARVAVGDDHTCVLLTDGSMKCWGNAESGRLGNGRIDDDVVPNDVPGIYAGISDFSLNRSTSCVVLSSGMVKCWGRNMYGEVGDGTLLSHKEPVTVSGLTNNSKIVGSGFVHTCAVTNAGGVKCWGRGNSGRLGNGGTADQVTPVDVSGLASGVVNIAVGTGHTCALTVGGGVKCWGANNSGQLGDQTTTNRSAPADVEGLSGGISALAAGDGHTCALTTGGGVKCWGSNGDGQLGRSGAQSTEPVDVVGLSSGVVAIAAGANHTCALLTNGSMKCWGGNGSGQLGDGSTTSTETPVDVSGLTEGVRGVALGSDFTCALLKTGGVKCWGANWSGQLGNGSDTNSSVPVSVLNFSSGGIAIKAGEARTCVLLQTGGLKCWGADLLSPPDA